MTFEKICRENLLKIAGAFAKATGLSTATVSRRFHGNQAFLDDYRRVECSITISKFGAMVEAFQKEWPKGAVWPLTRPAMISRPGKKVA
jgi:hypothetical protein